MIARRYDKAFFLRGDSSNIELQEMFNVSEGTKLFMLRPFEENIIEFKKNWTGEYVEKWIV